MQIATLTPLSTGVPYELNCGFKYVPYIPKKRISVKMTQKGSFTQKLLPIFVHGEEFVDFSIDLVTAPVAKQLLDFYNLDDNFTFNGIWGEQYLVEFSEYKPEPRRGPWAISGKLRVICVEADLNPAFQCS
jgi:hypothetical protein